jgi:hypothetical protein
MAKVPVFRISLTNALWVAGLYLVAGAGVEVVRRAWSLRWAERLSLSLEAFPARMLHLVGLFEPLRTAFIEGRLSSLEVRLVYGLTTVVLVLALGLLVGGLMWLFARWAGRGAADA